MYLSVLDQSHFVFSLNPTVEFNGGDAARHCVRILNFDPITSYCRADK